MYTNLLLFLVAIFLFSVDTVPSAPLLPGWQALLLFIVLLAGYSRMARKLYARPRAMRSAGRFEQNVERSWSCPPRRQLTAYCGSSESLWRGP